MYADAPSPGGGPSSSLWMSSPATPPVIAGVAARRAENGGNRRRGGGGGGGGGTRRPRGFGAAKPRHSNVIGRLGRAPVPLKAATLKAATENIVNDNAGRQMFQQFVASSSSSSSSVQRESGGGGTITQDATGFASKRGQREHRAAPQLPLPPPSSAYFPAFPTGARQSQEDPRQNAAASMVTLEGHHSFHEVEPRRRVPLPFALDGTPLSPGDDEWVSQQQFHSPQHRTTTTTTTTTTRGSGRSTSAHVLAHDRALRFPSTLTILWDRTPLRTPVIIPHERLLPSLWVSSQTVQALGFAAQQQQRRQQDLQRQSDGPAPMRPVGLLIGRATFPGRSGPAAEDEAAAFLGESRPVVCMDMFDPGQTDPSTTTLHPTHDAVADIEGVVMLPVSRGTLVPASTTITSSSTSSSSSSSTTTTTSPSWVSLGMGAVASHVLGLARACSRGGANGNIPTSSPLPGAGLWQIQCAVATLADDDAREVEQDDQLQRQHKASPPATTTLLQLRMCLPAVSLAFTLIESLPLLQTPLTSMLLHPATCFSDATTDATTTDALLPTHGLLTLNQVRRAVPILADDAAAVGPHRLPMVGAWIRMPLDVDAVHQVRVGPGSGGGRGFVVPSAAIYEPASPAMHRVLTDPAVWAACCQYLYNPRLRRVTGVGGTTDTFLLCIFPEDPVRPGSPRNPIFLECSVVDAAAAAAGGMPPSSTSAAFAQAGDAARPRMPVEMFQFSTQFTGSNVGAAASASAPRVERVADTMVSCRFRPLSSRDTAAQRELAGALDICTVRIGSAEAPLDRRVEEEGDGDSQVLSAHAGLCGVSPVAATLAAISVGPEDSSEYVRRESKGGGGGGGGGGEEGEEEEEVIGEGKGEGKLHHPHPSRQQQRDEDEEELTLQIRGGDFSVEFEDYDEFQSFAEEDEDEDENNSLDEDDEDDSPGAVLWHRGQGTPRTSIEVTGQPLRRKSGLGEDQHTLPAPVFWDQDVRVSRSFANGDDNEDKGAEAASQSRSSSLSGWSTTMRASRGIRSLEPHASATPLLPSGPLSSSTSSSSFRQDATIMQNRVQSSLAAHSVIASQQLEIRMLREQVEKLSVMVQRMDRQRQSGGALSAEMEMVLPKKAGSTDLRRSRGSVGAGGARSDAPQRIQQIERRKNGDGGDANTAEDREDNDVVQDQSPVDPMMRLSIPSFMEKADTVSREGGGANKLAGVVELASGAVFPPSASVPARDLAREDQCVLYLQ
jgi:hypothetical protein